MCYQERFPKGNGIITNNTEENNKKSLHHHHLRFTFLLTIPIICFATLYNLIRIALVKCLHILKLKIDSPKSNKYTCLKNEVTPQVKSNANDQRSGGEDEISSRTLERDFGEMKQLSKLYTSTTVWHETFEEMIDMVKTLCRLDKENTSRFKHLESHIVFDDAFDITEDGGQSSINNNQDQYLEIPTTHIHGLNTYVYNLIEAFDTVIYNEYQTTSSSKWKMRSPYGGQLLYILPRGTQIKIHLKDSSLVRTKKRWSLLFFLRYLRDYVMTSANRTSKDSPFPLNRDVDHTYNRHWREYVLDPPVSKGPQNFDNVNQNSYILMFDGDLYFYPDALDHLLDVLLKDPNIGASFGRIHPIGCGSIRWYQSYEFAIRHWLDKTADEEMGTSICCPGNFGFYRAPFLLSNHVIDSFNRLPETAYQKIRFDFTEDRYLSFLLAPQKIAFTHQATAYVRVPQTFTEYFNQRRRWLPGIFGNTLEFVKFAVKIPYSGVRPAAYMLYQASMLINHLIYPTITWLYLIAMLHYLTQYSIGVSFLFVITLNAIYILVGMMTTPEIQVTFARIICSIYTITIITYSVSVMLHFFTGDIVTPRRDTKNYDSHVVDLTPYMILMQPFVGFVITALMFHPKESYDILSHIPYYLVFSPMMSTCLPLYAYTNLHRFSWGTREKEKSISPDQVKNVSIQNYDWHSSNWINHEKLQEFKLKSMDREEISFWEQCIPRHLSPNLTNRFEKVQEQALFHLRNKALCCIVTINLTLLAVIVYYQSIYPNIPILAFDKNSVIKTFPTNSTHNNGSRFYTSPIAISVYVLQIVTRGPQFFLMIVSIIRKILKKKGLHHVKLLQCSLVA